MLKDRSAPGATFNDVDEVAGGPKRLDRKDGIPRGAEANGRGSTEAMTAATRTQIKTAVPRRMGKASSSMTLLPLLARFIFTSSLVKPSRPTYQLC